MTTRTMPMFPLGTVLLPGGLLPLHVFEPRYRVMIRDCLTGEGEFGVVLIERGPEVGGGDTRFSVGTLARIAEALPAGDGRWALVVTGTARLRVERWLADDPYPRAEVTVLDGDLHHSAPPDAVSAAEREVRRSLALAAELGMAVPPAMAMVHDEPAAALWQLAAMAPLGPLDAQRLLEEDDPTARAALLRDLAAGAAQMLLAQLESPGGGA